MYLGCIGDDFTGSSDLANTLAKGGMRACLFSGIPRSPAGEDIEAGIVALKSRTIPVADAVAQSLAALEWLKAQGCRQFLFKYCSTFDSTPEGNIGPVADALADALDATRILVCPAFPTLGRSVFQGHLFVGDKLLNQSGMEHHPLTPMTDPDIRRWLARQSRFKVGHIPADVIIAGRAAIAKALDAEHAAGNRYIVTDTIRDADLIEIGGAVSDLPLITGGSGIALGLPANFQSQGKISGSQTVWHGMVGPCAILSGSCSTATREQVGVHKAGHPYFEITADAVMSGSVTASEIASWAKGHRDDLPLVFSSTDPDAVTRAQDKYGRDKIASAIESLFAQTAIALVKQGVSRLITAGGETSGAVVEALDMTAMDIGPEIDPGVPALKASGQDLALALKSGNFGGPDFFVRAAQVLAGK